MLNLFNAPSVPLPKLLDILQILILQILSKIRELLRKRIMVRLRRRSRRQSGGLWTGRDGQHVPIVIVGCGSDFGCFESYRGQPLLSPRRLGWKGQRWVGGHRHRGSGAGLSWRVLKFRFLRIRVAMGTKAGTEERGGKPERDVNQNAVEFSGDFSLSRTGAGRGEDMEDQK